MHACVFCTETYPTVERLVLHLIQHHNAETLLIGKEKRKFKKYEHTGKQRILCLCNERFTCNIKPAPLFATWFKDNNTEVNSFVAHLKRERGLAAHVEAMRTKVLLDKVAGVYQ